MRNLKVETKNLDLLLWWTTRSLKTVGPRWSAQTYTNNGLVVMQIDAIFSDVTGGGEEDVCYEWWKLR
jgi:hypothetical protein